MSNREEQKFDRLSVTTDHASIVFYSQIEYQSNIVTLEQELINELEKLHVHDANTLSEKIQGVEQRIEDYRKYEQVLKQLTDLTFLNGTIEQLQRTQSGNENKGRTNIDLLEKELVHGLKELKVQDVEKLPEKIEQTEQRIKDYEADDQFLQQLKRLKLLDERIIKLKSSQPVSEESGGIADSRILTPAIPELRLTIGGNKRFCSNNAVNQSAKRFCEASQTRPDAKFFIDLPQVKPVLDKLLLDTIRQKYRQLCGCACRGFPGCHPARMHGGNYMMISQSPYMITLKSIGKRYMMLIEEQNKVYMLDQGDNLFTIDHIEFPYDTDYTRHQKDTLVDGELVIDKADGSHKPSFLINDIITYNNINVRAEPFAYRLMLISEGIINIRNNAIGKGHINDATQPFYIRNKDFWDLSEINKLLDPEFIATIPYEVDGLFFVPKQDFYKPGESLRVLKWKEKEAIEFRLEISTERSKIGTLSQKKASLFLNHIDTPFATIPYSSNLKNYHNKIISCSYEDSQWQFHRLRDDRPFPNSKQIAMGIINAIIRPVTKQVLCDFINRSIKGRVDDDDSSSTMHKQ